jgi:hypothetical protein
VNTVNTHAYAAFTQSSMRAPAFRQRHSVTRRPPDPGDAVSPTSPENAGVDHAPNPYSIRIDGYLGPTALSAFPDMVSQLKVETRCSPGYWIGRHSTVCWPRSRRSDWTSSSSAARLRSEHHQAWVMQLTNARVLGKQNQPAERLGRGHVKRRQPPRVPRCGVVRCSASG